MWSLIYFFNFVKNILYHSIDPHTQSAKRTAIIKGILHQINAVLRYLCHIKPTGMLHWISISFQIKNCRIGNPLPFAPVHSLTRRAILFITAIFYLHKNQISILFRDQIDFTEFTAKVLLHNVKSTLLHPVCHSLFLCRTKFMCIHVCLFSLSPASGNYNQPENFWFFINANNKQLYSYWHISAIDHHL